MTSSARLSKARRAQKRVYKFIADNWQLMTGDLFVYDIQGNLILEADQSGEILKEYLYLEGNRIAQYGYDDLQVAHAPRSRLAQRGLKPRLQVGTLTDDKSVKKQEIKVATAGALVGLLLQSNPGDIYSEVLYYYVNDHLGTPQLMVDHEGLVVWRADYDPFGAAAVDPGSSTINQHRFPGQYQDEETQLHYNYHRYYDPRSGRYLTPDPIGLQGGINVYAYVGNNPTNWMDFYGLMSDVAFSNYNRVTVNQNHPPNVPIVDWYPEQRTRYTRNVGHLYPTGPGEYPVGISAGTNYPARPMASPYTLSMIMCMTREMGEGFTMSDGLRTEYENSITPGAAQNSNHMGRAAVDVAAGGNVALQNRIMCAAAKCGFTRCQRYPGRQVHVDMGEPSANWSCPNPCTCNARGGPAPYNRPNTPNMGTP